MKKDLIKLLAKLVNICPEWVATMLLNGVKSDFFRQQYIRHKDVIIQLNNPYFKGSKMCLNPRFHIENHLLQAGFYDRSSLDVYQTILGEGDFVMDVGANVGSSSIPMAHQVGKKGLVLSFEPGSMNYNRLLKNLQMNPEINKRIKPLKIGLSSKEEIKYYRIDVEHNPGMGKFHDDKGEELRLSTLDGLLREAYPFQNLQLIKIDVEGMELDVVQGGLELIRTYQPSLYFESRLGRSTQEDRKIHELYKILITEGYEMKRYDKALGKLETVQFPDIPLDTLAVHGTNLGKVEGSFET